ncbi:hypothetical protein L1887_37812 [Cichorium endivia]|nr:hypothetical protein L1887_37812 [Cichorium endivia]
MLHLASSVEFRLLIKENGIDILSIPPARLEGNEGANQQAITIAIRKAVRFNRAIQTKDGHWAAEHGGPLFFTPPLIIILYISGAIDTHLTKEHKKEIKRFIYNHQVRIMSFSFILLPL